MLVEIPFEVEYRTSGAVPIEEVIDSLVSIKVLIEEGGHNLPHYLSGLEIEEVQVSVRRITHESPLRELFLVGLYLAVQKDLEREVPAVLETITGTTVPDNFKTILTLSVIIVLFYGVAYVKDIMSQLTENSRVKRQLDAIVKKLSDMSGSPEDEIRKYLDEHYKPKLRIKALASASIKFFRPSKSQNNATVLINNNEIAVEVVSDVPAEYAYEQVLDEETAKPFKKIELELHAKDKDRDTTGWAAVPRGISERRLRMKLVDGVSPNDLWGKDKIRGDIVVKYKRVGTDMVPFEIHLSRVLK